MRAAGDGGQGGGQQYGEGADGEQETLLLTLPETPVSPPGKYASGRAGSIWPLFTHLKLFESGGKCHTTRSRQLDISTSDGAGDASTASHSHTGIGRINCHLRLVIAPHRDPRITRDLLISTENCHCRPDLPSARLTHKTFRHKKVCTSTKRDLASSVDCQTCPLGYGQPCIASKIKVAIDNKRHVPSNH